MAAAAAPGPTLAGCPVFPPDNAWNRRVDTLLTDPRSAEIVAAIGDGSLHADFGSGLWEGRPIGIPITIVGARTPRSRVSFEYATESDRVPYPIPRGVRIEGGGDRHAILVDRDACRLYELYALRREGSRWTAGSGAVWSLRSNRLRPRGWTSADAAGLRLRLRADYPIAGFPRQARIVLRALKQYGMVAADNGTSWMISGAPDSRWSNDRLHTLGRVPGSAFEVVDPRSLRP